MDTGTNLHHELVNIFKEWQIEKKVKLFFLRNSKSFKIILNLI